jgi:hypothetical protein
MLSRPTTEQILRKIAEELAETVLPALPDGQAKVAVGMMTQLLNGCAVRAAHEIAWVHEEIAAIEALVGPVPAAHGDSLHLEDVLQRYHAASQALADAVDAAYAAGDTARVEALRQLLEARNAHEMAIVGALDLVGRG